MQLNRENEYREKQMSQQQKEVSDTKDVAKRKRPQITTHMPREMFDAFKETTARLGQNQSAVIRLFIQSYIDRNQTSDLGVTLPKI